MPWTLAAMAEEPQVKSQLGHLRELAARYERAPLGAPSEERGEGASKR